MKRTKIVNREVVFNSSTGSHMRGSCLTCLVKVEVKCANTKLTPCNFWLTALGINYN
jgi:hypothetical protein